MHVLIPFTLCSSQLISVLTYSYAKCKLFFLELIIVIFFFCIEITCIYDRAQRYLIFYIQMDFMWNNTIQHILYDKFWCLNIVIQILVFDPILFNDLCATAPFKSSCLTQYFWFLEPKYRIVLNLLVACYNLFKTAYTNCLNVIWFQTYVVYNSNNNNQALVYLLGSALQIK